MMKKRNKLRGVRFFSGKSQAQLWVETGVHFSTISRIENGYLEPTKKQRERLAEALGVDADWLFSEEDEASIED